MTAPGGVERGQQHGRDSGLEVPSTTQRDHCARFFAFFFAPFFLLEGQPAFMSRYDLRDTVDRDLGRDLPARLRRLIFATREFFCLLLLRLLDCFFLVATRRTLFTDSFQRTDRGLGSTTDRYTLMNGH